jgi:hypothetical protein
MRCCCCIPGAAAASTELLRLGAPLFALLLLPWIALLFLGALCLAKTTSVTAAAGAAAAATATTPGNSSATAAAQAQAAAQAAAAAAAAAMAAVPWTACILAPAAAVSAAGGLVARWIRPVYGTLWQWLSAPWLVFLLLLCIKLDAQASSSSLGSRTARALRWEAVFAPLQLFVLALLGVHYMLPLLWEVTAVERPRSANSSTSSTNTSSFTRVVSLLRSCAGACAAAYQRRKAGAAASSALRRIPTAAP